MESIHNQTPKGVIRFDQGSMSGVRTPVHGCLSCFSDQDDEIQVSLDLNCKTLESHWRAIF